MLPRAGLSRATALLLGLVLTLGLALPACAGAPTFELEAEQQETQEETAQGAKTEPEETLAERETQKKRAYSAAWTDSAFADLTVNAMDELVMAVGTVLTIDLDQDVELLHEGKREGSLDEKDVSFASSNKKYLTVSKRGKVSAERRGTAQLQLTIELPDGSQKQLHKNIKVVNAPEISFAPDYAVLGNSGKLDLGQRAKAPLLKASPNVDARVRYSAVLQSGNGGSKLELNEETGQLSVSFDRPGDVYAITAETYAGKRASFTLYLGERADRLEIQGLWPDADGVIRVASGASLPLKAVAFAGGADAARQDVSWRVLTGDDYASVDERGMLRIAPELSAEQAIQVVAYALDGGEATAQVDLVAMP